MVVLRDADAVNRVLEPVYAALGIAMDPSLTGCVLDVVDIPTDSLGERLAIEFSQGRGIIHAQIEATTLASARQFRSDHDPLQFV